MSSTITSFAEPSAAAQRDASRTKLLGLAILAGIWLMLFWVVLDITDEPYETTILLAILTTLVLPIAIQVMRDDLDVFEPIIFANIALASMFLARPLVDIKTDNWIFYMFGNYEVVRPGFHDMLWVAFVGIVTFQLGYYSRFPRKIATWLPQFRNPIDYDRAARIALFLFVMGLVIFIEWVRESGGISFLLVYLVSREVSSKGFSFRTASGYLSLGPLFWPPAALIAFSAWQRTKRNWHLVLTIFIMLVFFGISLGSGTRTTLIQGVLGIVVLWYIGRNRRPGLLLSVSAIAIALPLLAFSRQTRNSHTLDEKLVVLNQMAAHPLDSAATIWTEDDASMSDLFSVVVSNVPSRIPFGNGSTITDILLRAYPRFLMPGNVKPDENVVHVFKLLFPHIYFRYTSGAACSVIGELYEDHGTPAAALGMFVFGILLGSAKPWLIATRNSLPTQLIYVAMPAYTISLMRGGVPAFVEYLAITSVPLIIVYKYASRDLSHTIALR